MCLPCVAVRAIRDVRERLLRRMYNSSAADWVVRRDASRHVGMIEVRDMDVWAGFVEM